MTVRLLLLLAIHTKRQAYINIYYLWPQLTLLVIAQTCKVNFSLIYYHSWELVVFFFRVYLLFLNGHLLYNCPALARPIKMFSIIIENVFIHIPEIAARAHISSQKRDFFKIHLCVEKISTGKNNIDKHEKKIARLFLHIYSYYL